MELLSLEQDALLRKTRHVLGDLRELLGQSSASAEERTALSDSIRQLDELFLLVVAGEFNSGKSSFINALLGQTLQEVGVTPTTSHVYLLKYGETAVSRPIEAGLWEQTAPIELLRTINIVDTPGTNAIVREHEALTSEFIPRSDLVLFITSSDRPFSESERAFLQQIKQWGKKIVLVLNKFDLLENELDQQKVLEFVQKSAATLFGEAPALFPVSTRLATAAKTDPRAWSQSGFEKLEQFIYKTLDDVGRFRLKLLNPIGVGQKVIAAQLQSAETDLIGLHADQQLLNDIEGQMSIYNADMQRNFQARLGEIDNILYSMEKRGNAFFDETLRIARIPDLMRKDKIQHEFERDVVSNTPQQLELKVSELIDWLVEQDLRQWTAVADHLEHRRDQYLHRIVGEGVPREGTLAFDRQRLVDSIGLATRQAVATYDKEREAMELATAAQEAVVNTGILGLGGLGLGAAILAATQLAWVDVTGVLAGLTAVTLGLLVLPARRRTAKATLSEKLSELREKLVTNLTQQFQREMQRSDNRIVETIAPFSRFVRSETAKIEQRKTQFTRIESDFVGLKSQLQGMTKN